MRESVFLLGLIFSSMVGAGTVTNSAYIHDLEGLLNSVESRDPSRPQLTLKLADALFNEAITVSTQNPGDGQLTPMRRRAVNLYKESLSGIDGQFPIPSGQVNAKIRFQLARLYADLGEMDTALKIWQELAAQDSTPDLQRESLLRLAENLENHSSKQDLKRAEEYYDKALSLCTNQDVCSYTHYRLSWVYQRQGRLQDAVTEIEKSLLDSKGQVREEALRDMMTFTGGLGDDGADSLSKIEKLSAKLKRPKLVEDLSDAYFAQGNRKAGVYVLAALNRKTPSLKATIRLLEEDYGFRDWGKFEAGLDSARDLATKGASVATDVESEKVLRRLTVQLDGERASQPKVAEAFKRTVSLYMLLYPSSPQRAQMIDGWLAAETDADAKIKLLKIWIGEEEAAKRDKEAVRLREIRASLAQKVENYPVVAEEMSVLKTKMEGSQKRVMSYQLAFAQYKNKDFAAALPEFMELATVGAESLAPDKWAIQSQHLALDILASKKDYQGVIAQAQKWTKDSRYNGWLATIRDFRQELTDIRKIEISSEFEWATVMGETAAALAIFNKDCQSDVLVPQSCNNAQVLAVKLADQKTLIEVLQKLGKKDELAAELEASAEFAQAAQMLEAKIKEKSAATRDYLKVALLFELGGSTINRDRILHALVIKLQTAKTLGEEEDLFLQTLKDSQLIDAGTLKLAWKKENREILMNQLVVEGKAPAEIQKQLINSCSDSGAGWEKLALAELRRLDSKQSAIHFAGKSSEMKFKMRVAAMKTLMDKGNCYLQSTTAQQRVIFATLLGRAQAALADEIKAAPIPEGVDEEGRASLLKALAEMAQPFSDKAAEFEKLVAAQLEKVEDVAFREDLKVKLAAGGEKIYEAAIVPPTTPAAVRAVTSEPSDLAQKAIEDLHHNPNQRSSLTQLKTFYESAGNTRLAAYFQGRLLQLGEEVKR